jgi:hypothetical protein
MNNSGDDGEGMFVTLVMIALVLLIGVLMYYG